MSAPRPIDYVSNLAIDVRVLEKSFGPLKVLDKVDLRVGQGEVVALIGASGSGKTTLLRCVNLLEVPEAGSIFVNGESMGSVGESGDFRPIGDRALNKRRAELGMVFQRFNLFPHLTVLENVTLGPVRAKGLPREEARSSAMEQLERVGLGEKADSYPSRLSGGQQQRVAIARALALRPRLMLFDEPTSALDPELVGEVLETIRRLAEEGMTMLIVTHEMEFARGVADRIVFMHAGRILEQGAPEEIFTRPQHERTRAFLRRAMNRGAE